MYLIGGRCGLQHAVETWQSLHCRGMNRHCFDTHTSRMRSHQWPIISIVTATQRHMCRPVMIINRLCKYMYYTTLRKVRESRWIRILGSSKPTGINVQTDALWPSCFISFQSLTVQLCQSKKKQQKAETKSWRIQWKCTIYMWFPLYTKYKCIFLLYTVIILKKAKSWLNWWFNVIIIRKNVSKIVILHDNLIQPIPLQNYAASISDTCTYFLVSRGIINTLGLVDWKDMW